MHGAATRMYTYSSQHREAGGAKEYKIGTAVTQTHFVCDVHSSITLQQVVHIVTTVLLKDIRRCNTLNTKKKIYGLLPLSSYRSNIFAL